LEIDDLGMVTFTEGEGTNVDRELYKYLNERKLVNVEALKASMMETKITNDTLGNILVRNGFISQDAIVGVMIELEPDFLVSQETIMPNIPPELMKDNSMMIAVVTLDKVYASTLSSEEECAYHLKPYFPNHDIEFIPCNPEKLDTYLEKLDKKNAD
jgi:hypothetical protein